MQPQYLLEKELCAELGLELVDIPMSATAAPSAASIIRLLDTLDRCDKPALVHCKSGADRTGACRTRANLTGADFTGANLYRDTQPTAAAQGRR